MTPGPLRSYEAWLASADASAECAGLEREVYGRVDGATGSYPLVRYRTRGAGIMPRRLVITAGFHGEEPAGPLLFSSPLALSFAAHLAHARDVALDIFPCVNPTGFEAGTRYNRRGERPNNDLLRYELLDGSVVGELPSPGTPFRRWRPFREGPEETRALLAALEAWPAPDAALDLHQDAGLRGPATFAYIVGPRRDFRPMQEAAGRVLPLQTCAPVSYGATDAKGFIESHDGSITDYLFLRGARHAACVETSTDAPLARSLIVFTVWIQGMVALLGSR